MADLQLSLGDTSVPLTDFEQPVAEVIDSVLTGEADRLSEFRNRIESDRTGNSKRFTAFKKAVGDTIDAKGWFARGGLRILGIGIVVFGLHRRRPALDGRSMASGRSHRAGATSSGSRSDCVPRRTRPC